jgi:hypothetical protein
MKRIFCMVIVFLALVSGLPLGAQNMIRNSSITGVCYAGNKISRYYIPPPDEFLKRDKSKGGGSITIYYTGFSSQSKAAMEYAASILEALLPADTKFTVKATWEKISTAGVLAQSGITGYLAGWGIDALDPNSLYPVALAEKISGKSLNDDLEGDITLSVNSSINWYLGTDGQTPSQKYDLVTVVIHELCHGLGFFDSMNTDATMGWYGLNSVPIIYDRFIENFPGNKLTDTLKFKNFSADLKTQLTGGQLYFNGPLLKKYTSGSRAKLYVPSTWDAGSSVSHLDETTTLRVNSLMTPYIDLGEAIHDPGKYTFSILGDLGWINTRIIHTPRGDTEAHLTNVAISATIKSDTIYNHNKVGVVYSYDKFKTTDSLFMTSSGSNNIFNTTIAVPSYNSELQYYLFTEDTFLRLYRSPSLFNMFPHTIFIGTDTVKPVIIHTPVTYYLQSVDSVKFDATVTDNLGIDSVYVEYKINNGASRFVRMKNSKDDFFSTIINVRPLLLKGHDSIEYRIFAIDTAMVPNIGVLPKSGFFVSRIEEISSTLSSYSTDFSTSASDFFNIGFTVSRPAGFSKFGLHSKHPYESPEDNNKTINYTSILRHPLKFDESGMLFSYNEVVLVEPGEAGSLFGSSGFYDYVIAEGSKNFGKTWFNLIDGYDSRLVPSWETAYNSSIVGNNSTFVGSESMLQKHSFFYRPTDNISAGDTLLVRFRLFSDPFANGWGWVIEDLKINPLIDAIPEVLNHPFKIYPNPGNGRFKISPEIFDNISYKPLNYSVFNTTGVRLKNAVLSRSGETVVDISEFPAGMYIIILYLDDGIKTIKYSLIK